MKSRRPPGASTRAISDSAASTSATVHRTIVETTVSKLADGKGSSSAGASITSSLRRSDSATRARNLWAIGVTGSVSTSSSTVNG